MMPSTESKTQDWNAIYLLVNFELMVRSVEMAHLNPK